VDALGLEELDCFALLRAFRSFRDWKVVERDSELGRHRREVCMIADNHGDLRGELTGALAQHEIVQAVIVSRYEDRSLGEADTIGDPPAHGETRSDLRNRSLEARAVRVQLGKVEFDALEELAGNRVCVLVGV
jgi:hypothetical protein